jgi:hypothetical protein
MWFAEDIERIAQALIIANPDPMYRAGVATLAHALGARNVRVLPGTPTITQMVSGVEAVTR